MVTAQVPFLVVAAIVVIVVLGMWVPYHAGRRPLALYDQGSAIAVLTTVAVMSEGPQGLRLWIGGAAGLLAGLSACFLVHNLRHHIAGRSEPVLCFFYVCSFALYAASTALGTLAARTVLTK